MRSARRWAVVLAVLASVTACGDDVGTSTAPTTAPTTIVTTSTSTTTEPAVTSTAAPPAPSSTSTTSVPPPTTTTTTTTPPPTTAPAPPSSPWLRQGDEGADVLALQQRLTALGYWLGTPDGSFGSSTHHAVVALQKVAGIARDGVVGPATQAALDAGVRPVAQSSFGLAVEIDLARQVLLAVHDGAVQWTFDTSTGSVAGTTPVGHWSITRQIDGLRRSELGLLYRPKYFHEGVAVHGYTSVPPHPASHGCVRVTYPAMDAIWGLGLAPVGTPVWVR